jgi:polysaccharide biosynthesis protein PslH
MKVLFLCNKSPWPPLEGGPIAMNMLIEGLAGAGHHVKVLAVNSHKYNISEKQIPEEYRRKTGLELIPVDLRIKPHEAFFNLFTGRSYHVERFRSRNLTGRLREILQQEEFDIVQVEMLYMSVYLDVIRKYSNARVVLRAHNIEHLIWERIAANTPGLLKRLYLRHLAKTLKRYELSVLNRFDGLAAITEKDMRFFLEAGCRIPATDIPFGIDTGRYATPPGETGVPSLFSIGSMNWLPNEEGIRWFLDNAWNDIHREFPGLKLYIAGREMPAWLLNSRIPGVEVVGEVPDALQFMQSKGIMVVPLFSGSGIRIKIIEAMAAGKPVVSTTIGAEGIGYTNGENILIADSPCEFFEMISACVSDRDLGSRIGNNAAKLIREKYSRKEIIAKLTAFYEKIRS